MQTSRIWLSTMLLSSAAEITMFDDVIVVYKFLGDLMFLFVTGSQDENELILYQVLLGFYEAISILLRYQPCFPKSPPNFIHTVAAQDTTLLSSMSCKSCHDRASAGPHLRQVPEDRMMIAAPL